MDNITIHGEHPSYLFIAGMHGDESDVIDIVTKYLTTHEDQLPSYLYIPKASPSAVEQGTRNNVYNHDINRQFFDNPVDKEAKEIIDLLTPYTFDTVINFHEDPDLTDEFYMYDSGAMSEYELATFRKQIRTTGAALHTGIDDEVDPHLGLHIQDGYISTPAKDFPNSAGFSSEWLLEHRIAKRVYNPEIPGKAPIPLKTELVAKVFSFILQTHATR